MAFFLPGLVLCTVGITVCFGTEHVHVPTDTEFEGNHYGSCVCQQKCPEQDQSHFIQLMSALSSLEREKPSCPEHFVYNGGLKVCYKLFPEKRTWSAAHEFCRNLQPSAELAKPLSKGRRNFARYLVASEGLYKEERFWAVWLGGRREGSGNSWLWRDGETVTDGWGPDQPNGLSASHDCLGLAYWNYWGTSHLNDLDCPSRYAFICEYQMK